MNKTQEYRISQKMRKRIEELFGEAKEFMGLRRAKFRRLKYVKEQVLMTAAAQNIKRLVKHLSKQGPKRQARAVQQAVHTFGHHLFAEMFAIILYNYRKMGRQALSTP